MSDEPSKISKADRAILLSRIEALEGELRQRQAEVQGLRAALDNIVGAIQNATDDRFESLWKEMGEKEAEISKLTSHIDDMRSFQHPDLICVKPPWRPKGPRDRELCYLLMPFSEPWSPSVWYHLDRAARHCHLIPKRADEQIGPVVMLDIWDSICVAEVIVVDLTGNNPNVTYEVGIAHTLGKEMICLSQTTDPAKVPFDLLGRRLIKYDTSDAGLGKLYSDVVRRLEFHAVKQNT